MRGALSRGTILALACVILVHSGCRSTKRPFAALLAPPPESVLPVEEPPPPPKYPLLHKTKQIAGRTAKLVGAGLVWLGIKCFQAALENDDDCDQRPNDGYSPDPRANQANW